MGKPTDSHTMAVMMPKQARIYLRYFPGFPPGALTHFHIYQECLSVSRNNKRHLLPSATRRAAFCEAALTVEGPPSLPRSSALRSSCQKSNGSFCIECFN